MSAKVAVVIPVYREDIDALEQVSLAQVRRVLNNCPLIFVAPEGKIFSYFDEGDMVAHFPQPFFRSVTAYSYLLLSPEFYEAFADFDYILIYQLDAFVFYDALEDFCALGYDYIGAPWPRIAYFSYRNEKAPRVGNSGFCLRNVKAHYNLLFTHKDLVDKFRALNNDVFFSYCGKRDDCDFRVAPYNVACKFSAEHNLARVVKKNGGKLPFGCHKWFAYGADLYTPIFLKLGYDLRPLQNKMRNENYEKTLREGLVDEAFQRLERRLQRGQSVTRYLPRRDFASVRVIRHPLTMMILTRLLLENPALADKIFLYDNDEQDLLLDDLTLQKRPHLLISVGGS